MAGTIGQTVAYPLDVVRRRMQVCMPSPGVRAWRTYLRLRLRHLTQHVAVTSCGSGSQYRVPDHAERTGMRHALQHARHSSPWYMLVA